MKQRIEIDAGRGSRKRTPLILGTLLLCLGATALGGATGTSDWPIFRGDSRLSGVASQTLADELVPLWVFEVPEGIESSATVADGVVYVGGLDGGLYAIDLSTGKLRWRHEAGAEIKSSPSVLGKTVFFGDGNGTFHAVDTETGAARWTFQTEAEIVSSANFAGDRLVFGSHDQFLYCLAVADGSLDRKSVV